MLPSGWTRKAWSDDPTGIVFDATNLWVANSASSSVSVLQPSTGKVLATHAVNGGPFGIFFDGANVWVTNASADALSTTLK